MLRQFIAWMVGVLILLAIFTVLKGNVRWLTWVMFAWFVVGAVRIIRARKSKITDSGTTSAPVPAENGNQFDPEFCGRILRIAAICFVAMVVIEFIFFSTVKSAKCPGWQAPVERQSSGVWAVLAFSTIWAVYISYRAVTWPRLSQKILDQIEWARQTYLPGTNPSPLIDRSQFKAMCTVKNNINMIFVLALIASGLFVAMPALTRIGCF